MAFKQPRVPQETGGTLAAYVRNLTMFLRDFCMASWNADRLKDAEIEELRLPVDGGYKFQTVRGMSVIVPDRTMTMEAIADFLNEG